MLAALISAAQALREWLPILGGIRHERRESETAALTALYVALNEPRLFTGVSWSDCGSHS